MQQRRRHSRHSGVRPEMAYLPCPAVLSGKQRICVAPNEMTCRACGSTFWDNERCPRCIHTQTDAVPTTSYLRPNDIMPSSLCW